MSSSFNEEDEDIDEDYNDCVIKSSDLIVSLLY